MGLNFLQASSIYGWPLVRLLAPWMFASIACAYVAPRVLGWFKMWKTLRPMPGPWDLIPFWFMLVAIKERFKFKLEYKGATAKIFNQMRDICQEYTDKTFKVYIGFTPLVVIHTPDAAETLLTSTRNHKKPFLYHFIDSWLGKFSLLVSTDETWRLKRKLMTPAFHFRVLDNYLRIFNENGDRLVRTIGEAIDEAPEDPVRLFKTTQKCAMDIIGEVTMGEKLGLQEDKNLNFMSSFNRVMFLVSVRFFRPWFWNQKIYDSSSEGKLYNRDLEEMMEFIHSIIQRKSQASQSEESFPKYSSDDQHDDEIDCSENKNTLMNLLLKKHREDDRYSLDDVRRDIDTIIAAGNDTLTTSTCWTLNLLAHNRDAQRKVHAELDEIFGGNLDGEITADDLRKMKYLECCLKESLRLYPAFPLIGRVLDEDLILGGYKVPEGVMCFISLYSLHRNPKYFKDPESFIPERFMSEEIKARHPFSYIPFSGGSKNCIGQKFAMMEMKLLVAKVLRKYQVECKIPMDQLNVAYEVIVKDKGGNKVWFRRRPELSLTLQ